MNNFKLIKGDLRQFNSIEWRIQDSNESSLLFLKSSKNLFKYLDQLKACHFIITDDKEVYNKIDKQIGLVEEKEFLSFQKYYLDKIYPLPQKEYIGITGTNGKTSVSFLVSQLLTQIDKNVLTCGTLGLWINESKKEEFNLTTPSYIDVRKNLFKYKDSFDVGVFEVSSHALHQNRFFDIDFTYSAWTNFTQDHLDYHKTLDDYFNAKKEIFKKTKRSVVVLRNHLNILQRVESLNVFALDFKTQDVRSESLKLHFNQENLNLALELSFLISERRDFNLEKLRLPDGRTNFYEYKDSFIVIDYAHTPDALRSVCQSLKKKWPDYKLNTLFGCGGDRDKSKRPKMLEAALQHSDFVYLTSDNPRFENPMDIINDALIGHKNNEKIQVIEKRELAIKEAFENLRQKEILLIAGKGHENYTLINGEVIDYSDKKEVLKNIND